MRYVEIRDRGSSGGGGDADVNCPPSSSRFTGFGAVLRGGSNARHQPSVEIIVRDRDIWMREWNDGSTRAVDPTVFVAFGLGLPHWLEPVFHDLLWEVCLSHAAHRRHDTSIHWTFEVLDGVRAVRLELLHRVRIYTREMEIVLASFLLFPYANDECMFE